VHVVSDAVAAQATMTRSTLTLPLAGHDELAGLAPGDLVASGYRKGFLRRIEKARLPGDGTIVLETTPAALADAIISGSGGLQIVDGVERAPDSSTGARALATSALSIQLALEDQTIYDDGIVRVVVDELAYSFTPSLDVGYTFADHSVTEFHEIVGGTSTFSATASLIAARAVQRQATATLFRQEYTFVQLIGGFPVVEVVTFTLTGKIDASAAAAGRLTETISDTEDVDIGAEYQDGKWTPIAQRTSMFDLSPPMLPAISGSVKVGFALEARLDVKFYGVAGPFLTLELHEDNSLSYDSTKDPCTAAYDVALGIDSTFGGEIALPLGIIQPISFSTTLFDVILAEKMGTLALGNSGCRGGCDGGADH
jgi:hypothetical protein